MLHKQINIGPKAITMLLLLSIIACNRQNCDSSHIQSADIITVPVELSAPLYDSILLYPKNGMIVGDRVFVAYEAKNTENFIQLFNIDTKEHLGQLCNIGDGPDDYINPALLNDLSTENAFFIGDSKRITKFDLDSIREGYKGGFIANIPSAMIAYNYIFAFNDSISIYSQSCEHTISIYNIKTGNVKYIDYHPSISIGNASPYIYNMQVFNNCMTGNKSRVALAYHNWNIISIINIDSRDIKEIHLDDWGYNLSKLSIDSKSGNMVKGNEAKTYFTKIKSTPIHIFALGWDSSKEDMKNGNAYPYIYKLNWEGDIICKYSFSRTISDFCIVDESLKYAIGLNDDGELSVYECLTP